MAGRKLHIKSWNDESRDRKWLKSDATIWSNIPEASFTIEIFYMFIVHALIKLGRTAYPCLLQLECEAN